MECIKCKNEINGINFCTKCGSKLNVICKECWMKNGQPYNCGFDECPGYKLPILEKLNS
ncbi:hypothetical protein [Tepidibacter formicigenes]|jgi:hypothetical protein|uniref:Uncharacterized protein n=1 Tax=Tepidibacter formicigenes DSM 15518 TaxID=1123349 RepID=A0A1M6SNB6_9FIRM|nr:hypothetical protein [Tepidibacter formicigenes]SHK46109.1 hypothetical protein SAMN02744037_02386 [Tepidibacter formicigenes DSM 15518]